MPRLQWRLCLGLVAGACSFGFASASASAAEAPPDPAAILQDLRSFNTLGSVLHVAAHPDDENTQLITYLARGRGYRTAYLSVTRGDGGQNELGPEFDEKLGVARTQELLAARRLDGGRQFFTRAIDFGFSKTPEETLRFWDRAQVLADVVRIIRHFRPDVIVTRFPIPPGSGGHGHHTASGILAVEAFALAGDPKAYPEQLAQGLTVWQPKRVLWNGGGPGRGGGATLTGPTVRMDIGGNDPVTGEGFGSIASRSRGQHKTQFGLAAGTGGGGGGGAPSVQTFTLLGGDPATNDIMDGVDLTWGRYPGGADLDRLSAEAIRQFQVGDPSASVPALLAIRTRLAALPSDPLIQDKRQQLDHILQECLGLSVETTVENPEIVPGETLRIQTTITLTAKNIPVFDRGLRISSFGDLTRKNATPIPASATRLPPEIRSITLPTDTPISQPYWLREEGVAGIFRVDDPKMIVRPENPPAVPLEYEFEVGGQTLVINDEPVHLASSAGGERRRRLDIIPPVSLSFASNVSVFAPGASRPVVVEVAAARAGSSGTLRLEVPAGWKVTPASQPFRVSTMGEKARFTFNVVAPAQPAAGRVTAQAEVNGKRYANQRIEINYPHLPLMLLQPTARARLASFDVAVKGRKVGYLPGAGDDTIEALEQLGLTVTTLTGSDLTPEKLRGLDAVVIGVRAFNERTDLKENLPGLFSYVEAGGTVITQYNRPNALNTPQLGPYSLSIAGPAPAQRVTDENSPVTFLAPQHPVLTAPNKITSSDFEGWVQERGAYFPSAWDQAHYTPILALNDPNEAPLQSSVLIAKHGKGYYVYTGLGFFRQLPAGVPGAYRLFANLLSLGQE